MDCLDKTFEELSAQRADRTVESIRSEYRRAMLEPDGAAVALPVVRHVQEGELIKFVQQRPDGLEIESVIIPMWRGNSRWTTLCVSSQVGCAMGCTFCETAQLGLLTNLSAAQIVGQVIAARTHFEAEVRNVVFMGMGEPFDNFDEVI